MDSRISLSREEMDFAITSKNIVSRLCKVANYRERYEVERRKCIRHIDKSFEKLELEKLKTTAATLSQIMRDYILRSNEVMVEVLKHHLPRMRNYIRALPKNEYTETSYQSILVYEAVLDQLENQVNPILRTELEHTEAFSKTLSLENYVHFRNAHEKETEMMGKLFHETKVRLKILYRLKNAALKAKNKYDEFGEKHPILLLVFQVTLSFGAAITGFFASCKAVALLNKFFVWGEEKNIFNAYWASEYINELVERYTNR